MSKPGNVPAKGLTNNVRRLLMTAVALNVFATLGVQKRVVQETLELLPVFVNHFHDEYNFIRSICIKGYLAGVLFSALALICNLHLIQQRLLLVGSVILLALPYVTNEPVAFLLLFIFSAVSSAIYICGFMWCHRLWGVHSGIVLLVVFFQLEIGNAFGWLITQPFMLSMSHIDQHDFFSYLYTYIGSLGLVKAMIISIIYMFWPEELPILDYGQRILLNGSIVSNADIQNLPPSKASSSSLPPSSSEQMDIALQQLNNLDLVSEKPLPITTAMTPVVNSTITTTTTTATGAHKRHSSTASMILQLATGGTRIPAAISAYHHSDSFEPAASASICILINLILYLLILVPAISAHHVHRNVISFHLKRFFETNLDFFHEVQQELLFLLVLPALRALAFVVALLQGNRQWKYSLFINYVVLLLASIQLWSKCWEAVPDLKMICVLVLTFGHVTLLPNLLHSMQRILGAPLPNYEVYAFASILACGNLFSLVWHLMPTAEDEKMSFAHLILSALAMLVMIGLRKYLAHKKQRHLIKLDKSCEKSVV